MACSSRSAAAWRPTAPDNAAPRAPRTRAGLDRPRNTARSLQPARPTARHPAGLGAAIALVHPCSVMADARLWQGCAVMAICPLANAYDRGFVGRKENLHLLTTMSPSASKRPNGSIAAISSEEAVTPSQVKNVSDLQRQKHEGNAATNNNFLLWIKALSQDPPAHQNQHSDCIFLLKTRALTWK